MMLRYLEVRRLLDQELAPRRRRRGEPRPRIGSPLYPQEALRDLALFFYLMDEKGKFPGTKKALDGAWDKMRGRGRSKGGGRAAGPKEEGAKVEMKLDGKGRK